MQTDKDERKEQENSEGESGTSFPRFPLKQLLKVPEVIEKYNAGRPYDRLDLAAAMNYSPNSSTFRLLLTSTRRQGLTEGGYQADKITLTSLASSIVAPTEAGQRERALKEALLFPDLFRKVVEHYNKKAVPPEPMFKNTLRKAFHVAAKDVDLCYQVLMANFQELGLLQEIKGTPYLQIDRFALPGQPPEPSGQEQPLREDAVRPTGLDDLEGRTQGPPSKPKQVFIAHGKNKRPLEQLKAILTQFKVPYRIAIDEPHKGRPINDKVAEIMKECTSGIFIFTADEEMMDSAGDKVLRPSENVVFELGAGMLQYGDKIVLLREEGVSFGSDFTAYGHITFEKDRLDAKAFELVKELIALGFLQLTPT